MIPDRLPPHSTEAEQGILGTILLDDKAISECQHYLPPDAFYDLCNQRIYQAILQLFIDGHPVDVISLQQHLKDAGHLESVGGLAYLALLSDKGGSASNLDYYIEIVRSKFTLRRIIQTCTDAVGRAFEDEREPQKLVADLERLVTAISRDDAGQSIAVLTANEMIQQVTDNLEKLHHGTAAGIPTGFPDLDTITNGMRRSDYWIIAGRPSMGKSSLARQIIDHCSVTNGIPVGIFSLEENAIMFGHNMLHARARVNNRNAAQGRLSERDFSSIAIAASRIARAPFELCTKSDMSIGEIRTVARQMKHRINAQIFEVDYLQLASSQTRYGENREREMAQVSNGLKNMAKELDATVIATCQLNRKGENPGEIPKMDWLRESGQIEADADFIGALYYPDPKSTQAINLYVLKQRQGPRFVDVRLTLIKEFTRFESAAKINSADAPEDEPHTLYPASHD